MENYLFQWLWFVCTILSSITAGSVGESPPKKHRERSNMFYEMISGLIYAMPCIVFVCVYWAFFISAPCALLPFIEERDRCLESEKQARAIERIVPRASRELLENGEIISERRTNDDPIRQGEGGVGVRFFWRSRIKSHNYAIQN